MMADETHINDIVDTDLFTRMVDEGFIRSQTSPDGVFTIHNYTQRAQYDGNWNDATLIARGLITNRAGAVKARPFRKFFNLSQLDRLPAGEPRFDEKLDGSLGIGYLSQHSPVVANIATRGSLTSDQAEWATAWLHDRVDHMDWVVDRVASGLTPLFEIIYPENRIVVDYEDRAELVLLGCVRMSDGADVFATGWPGSHARGHKGLTIADLEGMDSENDEGYVLTWPCGTKAKAKLPTYVRLHKILTGTNSRNVWEVLAAGGSLDEMLELVPDEFFDWVDSVATDLRFQYSVIEQAAQRVFDDVPGGERREQARHIKDNSATPGVVFAMLDGKDYASAIWRLIRPETAESPFKNRAA